MLSRSLVEVPPPLSDTVTSSSESPKVLLAHLSVATVYRLRLTVMCGSFVDLLILMTFCDRLQKKVMLAPLFLCFCRVYNARCSN